MGLAPTSVWRVPPHPPLQLEDPSLKPTPLPSPPFPSLFPPPLLALFARLREGAAQAGGGGGVLGRRGGGGGGGLQAALGAGPTSGGTRQFQNNFYKPSPLSSENRQIEFAKTVFCKLLLSGWVAFPWLWAFCLVGLRTQTQNAAFFGRKGPERKPWPRGKSLNRKKRSQRVFWTLAF